MKNHRQPERWESSIFAAALAVAGTLFLSDKLGSLMFAGNFLVQTIQHTAPILMAALGLILLCADQGAPAPKALGRGLERGRHE